MIKANEYVIAKETGNGFKYVQFNEGTNQHSFTDELSDARKYKDATKATMVMCLLELQDWDIYPLTELSITL